jgi:hypothetical protein
VYFLLAAMGRRLWCRPMRALPAPSFLPAHPSTLSWFCGYLLDYGEREAAPASQVLMKINIMYSHIYLSFKLIIIMSICLRTSGYALGSSYQKPTVLCKKQ